MSQGSQFDKRDEVIRLRNRYNQDEINGQQFVDEIMALFAPSAVVAPERRALANAIAAIKPEWSEWDVGEESKQAWKDFVRGFQSGELSVVSHVATSRTPMRQRLMDAVSNGAPNFGLLADAEAEIARLERELAACKTARDGFIKASDEAHAELAARSSTVPPSDEGNSPEEIARREAEWDALTAVIHANLRDYEFGEEGYQPTDEEKLIVEDFVQGLLADEKFMAAIAQVYPVRSQHSARSATRPSYRNIAVSAATLLRAKWSREDGDEVMRLVHAADASSSSASPDAGTEKLLRDLLDRGYKMHVMAGTTTRLSVQDGEQNDPLLAWLSDVRSVLYGKTKPEPRIATTDGRDDK